MITNVETTSAPKPANASKSQVSVFAEQMAKRLSYHPYSKDIFRVIEELGGKIETKSSEDSFGEHDASLTVRKKGDFTVYLSALCGPDRNRFSAGHELGHYLMHYVAQKRTDSMCAARNGDSKDKAEWEANWFAGAFLMPSITFREIHANYAGNADLIALHFQVSRRAAEVRAEVLKLKTK